MTLKSEIIGKTPKHLKWLSQTAWLKPYVFDKLIFTLFWAIFAIFNISKKNFEYIFKIIFFTTCLIIISFILKKFSQGKSVEQSLLF